MLGAKGRRPLDEPASRRRDGPCARRVVSRFDASRGERLEGWTGAEPSDGNVEAAFEGSAEAIERLTDWCYHGPPGARVTSVVPRDEPPEGLSGFQILR
jgi:acylphosphatase